MLLINTTEVKKNKVGSHYVCIEKKLKYKLLLILWLPPEISPVMWLTYYLYNKFVEIAPNKLVLVFQIPWQLKFYKRKLFSHGRRSVCVVQGCSFIFGSGNLLSGELFFLSIYDKKRKIKLSVKFVLPELIKM